MAYTGAKSSVLLGIETAFGNAATLKYRIPFTSESINFRADMQTSEALLGVRGIKALAPGKLGAEGSLDVELYPETAGVLFYLALGKATLIDPDAVPSSGDEYTQITPIGLSEDLPSATIQVDHAGQKFHYVGVKVNQLTFSGSVGAIPKISIDVVGKDEIEGGAVEGTITEPGDEPYYFRELKLYTDNFTTTTDLYSSIELTINNSLDTDDYRLDGTGKRKTLEPQRLEITGRLDIIFDASVISGEYAKFKNFQDAALGIELAKSTGEKLQIYLPRIRFSEINHDIGGAEKIVMSASCTALIPASGDIIEVRDYVNTSGSY